MIAHHLPTLALMLALMLQAGPGFIMWSVSALEGRNETLGAGVGPDGSARETLADYESPSGSHRFRFIRRDRDGKPEQHADIDDVVYIQSGEGTLLVGGEEVPIEYFNEVRGGEVISSADNVPELTLGQPAGVSFLLFLDEFFALKRDRDRVLKAVADRVANMRPEDQAAVVAWDGKELTMLSGWTRSKSELSQAIDDALDRSTVCSASRSASATAASETARSGTTSRARES